LWRLLSSEAEIYVINALRSIFSEHGAPSSIVVDNAPTLHGAKFTQFIGSYKKEAHFRAAHRPSTNKIVERNHQTIKSSAARSRKNTI